MHPACGYQSQYAHATQKKLTVLMAGVTANIGLGMDASGSMGMRQGCCIGIQAADLISRQTHMIISSPGP